VFFDADSFVTADLAAAALRPSLFGQTAEDGAAGTAAVGGALGAGTGGATAAFAPSSSSSSSSSNSGGGGGASVSPEVARALWGAQVSRDAAPLRFEAPAVLARYAAAFLVPPACPQAQAHAARLASLHRAGLLARPLAFAFHAEVRGPGGGPLLPDVVLPVALVPDVGRRDGVGAASVGRRGSAIEGRHAGAAAAAALAAALGGQPPAESAAGDGGVEGDGDSESEAEEEEEGCRLYDDIDLGGLALLDRLSLRAVFPDQASDCFRLYFLRRLLGFSYFGVFFIGGPFVVR
jgi:hypothetical protein